jgi:hypothetical protein
MEFFQLCNNFVENSSLKVKNLRITLVFVLKSFTKLFYILEFVRKSSYWHYKLALCEEETENLPEKR